MLRRCYALDTKRTGDALETLPEAVTVGDELLNKYSVSALGALRMRVLHILSCHRSLPGAAPTWTFAYGRYLLPLAKSILGQVHGSCLESQLQILTCLTCKKCKPGFYFHLLVFLPLPLLYPKKFPGYRKIVRIIHEIAIYILPRFSNF